MIVSHTNKESEPNPGIMGTMLIPPDKKRFLHVDEASEYLGISEENTRSLLRTGQLRGVRVGKRWFIPLAYLQQLAEGRAP